MEIKQTHSSSGGVGFIPSQEYTLSTASHMDPQDGEATAPPVYSRSVLIAMAKKQSKDIP